MNEQGDSEPAGVARFQPPTTETTEAFWDATRREVYLVQWCTECDEPVFYPREVCPRCLRSEPLEWRPSDGTGTVYATSVQRRPAHPGMATLVPYVVVLVDLDAGGGDGRTVRIMSNVVDTDPDRVRSGDPVTLTWEPLDDGRNLALFRPTGT